MDGTLLDSEKLWAVSLRDTARWLGGELSASARAAVVGSNTADPLTVLFEDLGLVPEPTILAQARLVARTGELFASGLRPAVAGGRAVCAAPGGRSDGPPRW